MLTPGDICMGTVYQRPCIWNEIIEETGIFGKKRKKQNKQVSGNQDFDKKRVSVNIYHHKLCSHIEKFGYRFTSRNGFIPYSMRGYKDKCVILQDV